MSLFLRNVSHSISLPGLLRNATSAAAIALAGLTSAQAQDDEPSTNAAVEEPKPAFQNIDENTVGIGKIRIDKKTHEITFPATLGNPENIIEYLLVNEQGKIHETMMVSAIRPLHLKLALILTKYKASKHLFRVLDEEYIPQEHFHDEPADVIRDSKLDIFVEWEADGKKHSHHVNELIYNTKTKKHAKIQPYIFCGSYLLEGKLKAEIAGDMIAVFTDRGALANFSNEGREDDTIWFPNKKLMPKEGTKLNVVIRKHKPAQK